MSLQTYFLVIVLHGLLYAFYIGLKKRAPEDNDMFFLFFAFAWPLSFPAAALYGFGFCLRFMFEFAKKKLEERKRVKLGAFKTTAKVIKE